MQIRLPTTRWPWALALAALGAAAAPAADNAVPAPAVGSTAFCLFEVPALPERRLWINLTIVQYIEQRPDELRIYYGGGNLGSGYELRVPLRTAEEAASLLDRMRLAAARCAGR